MRQRALGKTGLVVSALGLGTFGVSGDGYGPVEPNDARESIERALELGVTLFETADAYGAGSMESLFGELLSKRPEAIVVTKAGIDRTTEPPRRRFDAAFLAAAIERSRTRLQRDAIDVYLLHNPSEEALTDKGALETLLEAKHKGHVKHVGVATGRSAVARLALEKGAEVISLPYNLLHVQEMNRIAGDVLMHRPGVLAHSPLGYGILASTWREERAFGEEDHRSTRWSLEDVKQRVRLVDSLRFLVKGSVPTPRGAALRFALSNELVSSVLMGPKSKKQLEELVRDTGDGPVYLPESEVREVFRTLDKLGVPL